MKAFNWNKNFETGLTDVDHQHRNLVDIVNQFGLLITENRVDRKSLLKIFTRLCDYTEYHFKDEESMMKSIGIDPRHLKHHIYSHHSFLEEVSALFAMISEENISSTKHLLDYLIHWLAYHILGQDQHMARQIEAIQSGMSPAKAYEMEERERDKATEPLLFALSGLFEQVSARNRELLQLNQSLEKKVTKRTRELSEANSYLKELSITDPLTGLPNRRHAMHSLDIVWEESIREQSSMVCMVIDVDHFKEVNDTSGHDAGDVVLMVLAKSLQHSLRSDDIVCRLGGDEFMVICPKTDSEGGLKIAELTRQEISKLKVPTGEGFWRGSISVGVAARTDKIESYDALIKAADTGVYAAKAAGKNCVRMGK